MKTSIPLIIASFLLLLSGNPAIGQTAAKQVTNQQLMWFAFYQTTEFTTKWFLTTEVQERFYVNPTAQHQFLVRAHMHYRLGAGWDAAVGFTYFLQSPQDPNAESNLVVPEYRPHIEFNYRQTPTQKLTITHRYKTEWRFFTNVENGELAAGTWDIFRFRYRIGVEYRLLAKADGANALKLKVSNEIMLNAGSIIVHNTFDQNRISASLNYQLTPQLAVEAGYINWFQQRPNGTAYYNRNIIRVALTYRIALKNGK